MKNPLNVPHQCHISDAVSGCRHTKSACVLQQLQRSVYIGNRSMCCRCVECDMQDVNPLAYYVWYKFAKHLPMIAFASSTVAAAGAGYVSNLRLTSAEHEDHVLQSCSEAQEPMQPGQSLTSPGSRCCSLSA